MNTAILCRVFLIFVLLSEAAAAAAGDCFPMCPKTQCGEAGPEIMYPFRKVEQDSSCGAPGFELNCTADNRTILNLPIEGQFYVQSIDYDTRTLQIGDPQGSHLNRTIAHLNLSSHPFYRSDNLEDNTNYTILNCASRKILSMESWLIHQMDCCKNSDSQIYAINSYTSIGDVPFFCERLEKTSRVNAGIYKVEGDVCRIRDFFTLYWETPLSIQEKGCGGLTSAAMIGIIATIIFSAALAMAFYYWDPKFGGYWELDRHEVEKFLDSYQSLNPKRYSYSDLKKMTNHFRQKIGEGGFGSVYRGRLPNGIPVAVKTLLVTSKSNGDEFLNEVATIGRVHHVNVVRLLGFCAERFKRALIYEFMPNGSLEKFIFSSESQPYSDLGWHKLQEIAVGIARGIEYLHQGCDQRILHFDIKPHNILLDHKFTPKISDFGLAKFCAKDQSIVSMTAARGTVGYIAPEVVSRNFGNISYKSDVYSFGMMLVEIVGKRKNIDVNVEQTSQVYFPEWIYNRMNLQLQLGAREVVSGEEDEIAKKLVMVALWCIQINPADRPNMKKVVHMLGGATETVEIPPNPFVSSTASPLIGNVSA